MTWPTAWEFGPLRFIPALTVSAPTVSAPATAIGVPNVVLLITRAGSAATTTVISPAVTTGLAACLLRVGINVSAQAVGMASGGAATPVRLYPLSFAATAVGVPAVSVESIDISVPAPDVDFELWLSTVIALLDDIVAKQQTALNLSQILDNINLSIDDLPRIVQELYTLRNMSLTNIRRQEMARTLSGLSLNLAGSTNSLASFNGEIGAATTAVLDDVDTLRTLMSAVPGGALVTPPLTTFLSLAATAVGSPNVTVARVPAPPTAYFVTAAATARGVVNVAVSVIRAATPSSYAVTAAYTALGIPNESHVYVRGAARSTSLSIPVTAVGVASETHSLIRPDTAYPLKYFGFPWLSGSLAQNSLKSSSAAQASTFRAPKTGFIKGFRWFLAAKIVSINGVPQNNGNSYGFGNGGIARAHMETSMLPDNKPSGTWVGGTSNYDQMVHFLGNDAPWVAHDTTQNVRHNGYPYFTFPTPCGVTKGGIYHLVFKNADADPSNNWYSVDNQDTHNAGDPSALAPALTDQDWGLFYFSGGNWVRRSDGYYPICQIEYTDGFQWGCASDDNWNGYYVGTQEDIAFRVTPTDWVRENAFSPPQNVTVTHINVCAGLSSGSGTLIVEVLDTNDTVLRSVSYLSSTLPTDKDNWAGQAKPLLSGGSASPLQLLANTRYRLRYRATGGSYTVYNFTRTANSGNWRLPSVQANNYVDPGWINNARVGWAQRSTNQNSGWVDFNGARESHLVFYFVPQ